MQKHEIILPTLVSEPGGQAQRRRVSFESNVMEHSNTVPQSPNTRRRIFNFTPISPSPHSPINGRVSKSNSANASPFVSPRNTPVPRSRSSIQAGGGCKSRGVPKTLSRSISCSVPYTGKAIDTFIVPTSGPDVFTKQLVVTTTTKSSEVQVSVTIVPSIIQIEPRTFAFNFLNLMCCRWAVILSRCNRNRTLKKCNARRFSRSIWRRRSNC